VILFLTLMSTPLAGKFQDHYDVLGIDPRSDSETLQSTYAELARKYHPNNPDTGDQDAFDAVNAAYEVLSDPAQRLAFDNLKGVGEDVSCPLFSGTEFFESLGSDAGLRVALLCILYERRKKKPLKPGLPMRYVEAMLNADLDELFFVLWYAKQRGWVSSDDKSNLLITVQGMDYLDSNRPSAAQVLPHIKPTSIANNQEAPANVLVAALDAALASRAFQNDDAPERAAPARTSPAGPN
jgi:curved DNA-binding protein CbpA